jgi:tetratricopeptide (TPR) repeat protein
MEVQKTVEQIEENLGALNAKAKNKASLSEVSQKAIVFCGDLGEKVSFEDILRLRKIGLWADYHLLRKYQSSDKTSICRFLSRVEAFYEVIPRENIKLLFEFGYLLSVSLNELGRPKDAQKIEMEINILSQATGNVGMALGVVNAEGLILMGRKEWKEALAVFLQAEKHFFPEEKDIVDDDTRHRLANILSNRGLSAIQLSETVLNQKKDSLLHDGLLDLAAAIDNYSKLAKVPQGHIIGVENRAMIASRIILLSQESADLVKVGEEIAREFSAGNREGVKSLIHRIKDAENIGSLGLVKSIFKKTKVLLKE